MMNAKTRQISRIKISKKERVEITISETVILEAENQGDESREIINQYPISCGYKPHKDFMESLLSCRKYALDLGEFSNEDRTQYTIESLDIIGNMALQNSRVQFTLNKWVKRTGKSIKIQPGECIMYGDEYKESDKMAKQVEKVIAEAWNYINGKNGEGQLCLLFNNEAVEA